MEYTSERAAGYLVGETVKRDRAQIVSSMYLLHDDINNLRNQLREFAIATAGNYDSPPNSPAISLSGSAEKTRPSTTIAEFRDIRDEIQNSISDCIRATQHLSANL